MHRMEVRSGVFIDWLTIRQEHPQGCSAVNGGQVFSIDPDGVEEWRSAKRLKVPGSFETGLQVRSDGHAVEVSGNPSRWCRPDNVFGFDVAGCVEVINGALAAVGLPPFTAGHRRTVADAEGEGVHKWTGARISRIDVTENWVAGSDRDAREVLRYLQGQAMGARRGTLLGETTMMFGAGRRMAFKVYLKGAEMRAHGNGGEVANWCESNGVVRVELTLRGMQLSTIGVPPYVGELLQEHAMAKIAAEFTKRCEVLRRGEGAVDDLSALPKLVQLTAFKYRNGEDVRQDMNERTFYRHRKALLHLMDIAVPPPPRKAEPKVRPIILRPAVAPDWYSFERTPYVPKVKAEA